MSELALTMTLLVAIFAAGAAVGFVSRRFPMSAAAALVLPLALPAVGCALATAFC